MPILAWPVTAKQLKKNPPGPEVFEQHIREHLAVIAEAEKEVLQGEPYNHSHLLEPYLSEMLLYGYGGYDIKTRWLFSNFRADGYPELDSLFVEPIFMRDTIAVVRVHSTLRIVGLDGSEINSIPGSEYYYYAKRNGRWIGTNSMKESSLHGFPPVGGMAE